MELVFSNDKTVEEQFAANDAQSQIAETERKLAEIKQFRNSIQRNTSTSRKEYMLLKLKEKHVQKQVDDYNKMHKSFIMTI
jgi:hypothetical protein